VDGFAEGVGVGFGDGDAGVSGGVADGLQIFVGADAVRGFRVAAVEEQGRAPDLNLRA
jgi:hypothetical protein